MRRSLLLCLLLFSARAAYAQTEIRDSVAGFPPSYFADSNPSSAYEMVQLLPGFRPQGGNSNVRGYSGSLGNVLIDGQPPASKQDSLETQLKRIPASSVLRIELIRPGAAGIDMQGFSLLANVVRKVSNAPRGRAAAEVFYIPHVHGTAPRLDGELSIGTEEVLDLTASVWRSISDSRGGVGRRDRYAVDGTPLYLAESESFPQDNNWTVSGTYRQPLWGGDISLGALYKNTRGFTDNREITTFPVSGSSLGSERDFKSNSEFTLQYSHDLWDGGQAQLIGIRRGSGEHAGQTAAGGDSSGAITYTSESILRGSLRQQIGGVTLESGAESAINTLVNSLTFISGGTKVILPGANVRISEWRTEFFGTATWQALPDLTLQSALRYEMSSLKQQTTGTLKKDLHFLKPLAMIDYQPTADDELRLTHERRAGQLDFANFIPSVNFNAGSVTVGNADLEPDTRWRSEFSWEHSFASGSITLTARREAIRNVVDRVPIFSPSGVYDAVGNIGSGRRDEYQADLLLPLDDSGLSGMTLQGSVTRRFSQVVDPTTGDRRIISGDAPLEGSATLTGDLPDDNLRWGITYTRGQTRTNFRFNEVRATHNPETLDLFVEYTPLPQWLLRFSAKNILDQKVFRNRDAYSGPRNTQPLNFVEPRPALIGARFGFSIQRTLGD